MISLGEIKKLITAAIVYGENDKMLAQIMEEQHRFIYENAGFISR